MTKKRIKFGLVILGLTAFLLALLALVFVPTGASAGKGPAFGQDQDDGGHSNQSSLAYFDPPNGHGPGSNPNPSNGGGAGPCASTPNPCDTHDDAAPGHDADGQGGQGGSQGGGEGNGQGDGHSSNNDTGGQGGYGNPGPFAGGYPGGGSGAPQDQSNSCSSKKESGDKTCNNDDSNNGDNANNNNNGNEGDDNNGSNGGDDAGQPQFFAQNDKGPSDDTDEGSPDDRSGNPPNNPINNLLDPPSGDDPDEGLPPIDPNCFVETCDTHGGNPPNTDLTDPPAEVPEPLTLSLFAVGLTGVAALRRRQKTAAQPE